MNGTVRRVRALLLLMVGVSGCASAASGEAAPVPPPRGAAAMQEYNSNIVRMIHRRWQAPSGPGDRRAVLAFVLNRAGKAVRYEWIERSGDGVFDRSARAAIEAASEDGAFGPLPASFEPDSLRMIFTFEPS